MSLSQRLNKRVMLQQKQQTQDAAGQPAVDYVDIGQVWAEVIDVYGKLFIGANQEERSTTTEMLIRYRDNLPSPLYVLHKNERYEVQGDPLGQTGRTLKLVCLKVKP